MTALSTLSLKNIRESQSFKNYNPQYKQEYFPLQQKLVRKTIIPGYKPHGSNGKRQPNHSDHSDRLWWPNPSWLEEEEEEEKKNYHHHHHHSRYFLYAGYLHLYS
jgi:hypothetical protein